MASISDQDLEGFAARTEVDAGARRERLPARDYILLPLVVAATLLVLALGCEGAARLLWPEHQADACQKADGSGFRSNCVSRVKIAEGPWVEYRYNDCGLRADRPCAKAPGARRIAVAGTSISSGYWVPFDQAFAGRLEQALGQACRGAVDVQTQKLIGLGGPGGAKWGRIPSLVPAALATQPDVLVTVIAPFDLEEYAGEAKTSAPAAATPQPASRLSVEGLKAGIKAVTADSRAAHMAQHFFYLDMPRYLPLYLQHGDAADFLRPPLSAAWRARLGLADKVIGDMAGQARAAGVPLVVAFMPNRAEAALAAAPQKGVDAYALPQALGEIARRHGAAFVDATPEAARAGHRAELFYPVDGHPDAAGHAVIAKALAPAIAASAPAFKTCSL